MTTELHQLASVSHDRAEALTLEQKESLVCGVAKIVALGAQTGVSTDQMIALLKSGLTVSELLAYLAARCSEIA
jgi:hypothetical protein